MGAETDNNNSGSYVIDYAQIHCDMAGKGNNFLRIPCEGCGATQNGGMNAHKKSCVAYENIMPFSKCVSPYYIDTITELLESDSPQVNEHREEYKKYRDAAIAKKNQNIQEIKEGTCILALLDEWFDPDEKMIIEENRELMNQFHQSMEGEKGITITGIKNQIQTRLEIIINRHGREETLKCTWAVETIGDLEIEINSLLEKQEELTNKIINIDDIDYDGDQNELNDLYDVIGLLITGVEIMKALLPDYQHSSCDKIIERLNNYKIEVDERIKQLRGQKKQTYSLITTDSFLVCRCKGLITFLSSGQEHKDYADNLLKRLVELIDRSIEIHQINYNSFNNSKTMKDMAIIFGEAIDQFKHLKEYALSSEPEKNSASKYPVFVQSISKSYYDEIANILMGVLSIAALASGMAIPQYFVAGIDMARAIAPIVSVIFGKDDANEFDGAVAGVSVASDLETIGESLNVLGNTGAKVNTPLTIMLAVGNFFYVSDNTWIEEVRITMFIKKYAFVSIQHLNEKGERVSFYDSEVGKTEYKIAYYDQSTYQSIAAGIQWTEEAGIKEVEKKHASLGANDET